jgi:hypothetical protein
VTKVGNLNRMTSPAIERDLAVPRPAAWKEEAREVLLDTGDAMLHLLVVNWVYGGFLAGLLFLLLSPLFVHSWPPALAATFFCLPAYMLHQYEEHEQDRFRVFMNRILAGGKDALTLPAVFIIHVPGVWGVIALSLWLAARVHPGFALIAVYLPRLNAAIHIAHAAIMRSYNPGLVTAIALFLPVRIWCLRVIQQSGDGSCVMHAIGLGSPIGIYAVIAVSVLRNRPRVA